MRPIYKGDIEFPSFWPGVVLTTDTEQKYLNQAVDALSETDSHERVIRSGLVVERFIEPDESDMQARMNHAWRVTGGDDDPAIFPDGRPLSRTHIEMAIEALEGFMTNRTNLDPSAIQDLIDNIQGNLAQSTEG